MAVSPGMGKPVGHKPKRLKHESDEEDNDTLAQQLAAYGERFMQMFDDHDDSRPAPRALKQQQTGSDSANTDSDSDGEDWANDTEDSGSEGSGGDSDGSGGDSDGSDDGGAPADNIVEAIFDGRKAQLATAPASGKQGGAAKQQQAATRGAGPAGGAGGLPRATQQQQQQQQQEQQQEQQLDLARLKEERRRFMSHRAAIITGGGSGQQAAGRKRQRPGSGGGSGSGGATPGIEEVDGVSRADFLKMQREVQLYGASALDKKSKKKFEADMLAQLGAKAEARPRIPAAIGKGMARKQAQREQRALEEGIAAGMIQQKGLGKKKRREKAKSMDRGLMEDGGAFRPGIMRVKPLPAGGGSGGRRGGGGKFGGFGGSGSGFEGRGSGGGRRKK